ncbi:MAG: F0F1 ATP synthase subunit delta [Rhodospirillaceae bacterium]
MASDGTAASGLAARYSAALFDLATERNKVDEAESDLTRLKGVLAQSPDLRRFLRSPVLTREQQNKALEALLGQVGVSDLTQHFVGLVAKNRRLFALGDMIEAFLADLARRRGEVSAEITVARSMTDAQTAAMNAAVKSALGDRAAVKVSINPELLGGMVVKIGSRMIDNSLRTKIDKLQLALKAPGGLL